MSITSSNNQGRNSEFVDLLVRHAGLAGWLSNAFYSRDHWQAQDLLPRFLAECANQGIPETAYPFTASDQALSGLQDYLLSAFEELEAFHISTVSGGPGERADSQEQNEGRTLGESLKGKMPALETTARGEAGTGEEEEDVAQLVTAQVPAVEPAPRAEEVEPTPRKEETMSESAASSESEEDVAQLVTAQVPAVVLESGVQEAASETAAPEPAASSESVEDVAQLATAQVPAVTRSDEQEEQKSQEDEPEQSVAATRAAQPVAAAVPAPVATLVPRRKSKRPRKQRTRKQRILSWVALIAVLGAILVPAIALVNFGLNAYNTYRDLSSEAHSAVNHLMDVKTIFSGTSSSKSHLTGLLDANRLQRAQQDFVASERDFQQLQKKLKQSTTLQTVTTYLPQYRETLASAQEASIIGIDVAKIGQIATAHASQIAPTFSGSLLAATGKPLVTQDLLDTLNTTIDQVMPLLKDIQAHSQHVSLASLPISASQKTQVGQLLQLLPQAITDLGIARGMLGDAGWLLGVNQPRTFLVQTMDRAELRGAGGFTGQYGELTITGGRVAPFSLKDISQVEYTNTSVTQGQLAPLQYRSWWPFPNWGLRDSNVSADFPTTAQLAINLYKQETGRQVDGVISFTPVLIEHVLAVLGPIQVPGYNTTVTAQNLEDVLHYYQLDNSGILKQIITQHDDTTTSQRKRFTNYLSSLVMAKVRNASADKLLGIADQMIADLKSKDLQVYFSDPASEKVLAQYGYAGTLDRSTTHDGLYVVQENLSASKASQYVQTILHDTVTLDSKGGATHTLQIRLVYNQAGPVYGYDTYYDYMRVYVPASAQLISGDGFSTGTPLCGGRYGNCPVDGPYAGGELVCPAGQYQPGAEPPTFAVPDGGSWQPLQTLGGPTNVASDEPGRAMYGGWVIVPKNCTMNVSLSWYVPPMSAQPYTLLVQRQAGTFPELDLSILPSAANCAQLKTTGLHFDKTLTTDAHFSLPAYSASPGQQNCYPRASA